MQCALRAAWVLCGCLVLWVAHPASGQTPPDDFRPLRPEVEEFIAYMVQTHGFDSRELHVLFAPIQPSKGVTRAMTAPSTSKPWYEFKPLFVDAGRISGGAKFWNENANALQRARAEFGVPEAIVVALIGIETRYGRQVGGYRTIEALSTLAFDWPSRRDFFRGELEQFLLLTHEQQWDPTAIKGSFAGALGLPQFMPSSYRRYAVDYDRDGHVDLWRNPADVIGSVANYLKTFGWRADAPAIAAARTDTADLRAFLDLGVKPSLTLDQWRMRGIDSPSDLPADLMAGLFSVDLVDGPQLWFGFDNFYALFQYNRSRNYVMAVLELANEITRERDRTMFQPRAFD